MTSREWTVSAAFLVGAAGLAAGLLWALGNKNERYSDGVPHTAAQTPGPSGQAGPTASLRTLPAPLPGAAALPPAAPPLAPAPSEVPAFAARGDRDEYRGYWVREFARRAGVYRDRNPSAAFPGDRELESFFSDLYDASEPRTENESAQAYDARAARRRALTQEFVRQTGAVPDDVWQRVGDAQYGATGPVAPHTEPAATAPEPTPTPPGPDDDDRHGPDREPPR
jgi:hypothetical protein